jgi:D-glycero-D-manno-heptose 1,7-bisphosphate phosphatase
VSKLVAVAKTKNMHLPDDSRLTWPHVSAGRPAGTGAIFLDRDGVIVEDVHYLSSPSQINILPGVTQAICLLQSQFYIIVITNQSGIARGLFTEEDLLVIHAELVQRLAAQGALVDALYYCPHLPEAAEIPAYQAKCNCRKPKPGLLLQASQDWNIDTSQSFMIGDTFRDIQAGAAAGVKSILLASESDILPEAFAFTPDLAQAAHLILA